MNSRSFPTSLRVHFLAAIPAVVLTSSLTNSTIICASLIASGLAAATDTAALAGGSSAEPVGFCTIQCLGKSDTIVSAPLARLTAFIGSGTASIITAGSVGKISFGDASFTTSQFKYDANTQTNTYYALLASGTKSGSFYTITDNDSHSVTIDLNGDDISAVSAVDSVKIIPYWTLGTLFPSGSGVNSTTTIRIPSLSGTGINLPAEKVFYYSSSAGCWSAASGSNVSQNDYVLYPDHYFVVRNLASTKNTITVTGSVVVGDFAVPIAAEASGRQDNYVAIPRPVATSLDDSGLISSGAFRASTASQITDLLFVFNNNVARLQKNPSATYFYRNGAWRRVGVSGKVGDDLVFRPGSGVIIRKYPAAGGTTELWQNLPTYNF